MLFPRLLSVHLFSIPFCLDILLVVAGSFLRPLQRLAKLLEIRIVLLQMHAQRQGLVIPDDAAALPVDKEHPAAAAAGGKWIHQQHYASVPGRRTSDGAETDRSHASSSSSSQWAAAAAASAHPRYGHGHGAAAASSSSSASSPAPRSLSLVSDHAAVASASALRARSPSMESSRGRARRSSGGRIGQEEVDELASEEEEDDACLIAQRRRQLPSIRDHPDLFLRRSPESFLERNNGDANEDDRSVKLSPIMGYNAEPATKRSQQQPRAAPKRKMTTVRDAGLDAAGSKRVRRAAEATTRTQASGGGGSVAQERKHSQDSTASSVAESYASARSMTGSSACSGEESRQSHAGSTTTTTRRPTGLDMLLNAVSCSERGITSLSS